MLPEYKVRFRIDRAKQVDEMATLEGGIAQKFAKFHGPLITVRRQRGNMLAITKSVRSAVDPAWNVTTPLVDSPQLRIEVWHRSNGRLDREHIIGDVRLNGSVFMNKKVNSKKTYYQVGEQIDPSLVFSSKRQSVLNESWFDLYAAAHEK
jgi:hypothetical protein